MERTMIRRVDNIGRLVLPVEIRNELHIDIHDPLEIKVKDDVIIIRKYYPSDVFDGSIDDLIEYQGKQVSRENIRELAILAGLIDE